MTHDSKRKRAPYRVGTRLRYVGTRHYLDADGSDALVAGMVGVVVECRTGYDAHTHDFGDGQEHVPALDDWSVIRMPCGFQRAITYETRAEWVVE